MKEYKEVIDVRFEAIPYKFYENSEGQKASIYGVKPDNGYKLVVRGFTVFDHKNNVSGCGRAPFLTSFEAQAFADKCNKTSNAGH